MHKGYLRPILMAGVAAMALLPVQAMAQTAREAELEARLSQLEAAVSALRSELKATRSEQRAVAKQSTQTGEKLAKTEAKLAAIESKPAAPATPGDGFNIAGTTVKFNGFIKGNSSFTNYSDGDLASGSLGKDFYLPQTIPIGGTSESTDFTAQAKQTRLWLTTSSMVGSHKLEGRVEFDFQTSPGSQGSQRTTNGYNLTLRRAFVTYDNFLFGQEWTNFQYVAALPETTDFVGVTEGTVFIRQMQARYALPLTPRLTLSLAAENPESATITPVSATLVENDDDRMPDFTARLNYKAEFGELSLAALGRELSVDNGNINGRGTGWGVSGAGKIPFGPGKRHDVRFMATYGEGIGRYVGLNLAPDAVFSGAAGSDLEKVTNFAAFAAMKLGWTETLRSTFMASYQSADYHSAILPALANEGAWSVAANLFWSPVKPLDLGVEFRHGERDVVSGDSGSLDRIEFAAKYAF